MNNIIKILGVVLIAGTTNLNAFSQCAITASGYPVEICKGDPVTLTASGACGYLMLNDFNNGTIGLGWYSNASPMFNNPCPPTNPPATGIVCWIGSATNFPRELTTIAYNLAIGSGYTIDWDMKYGANQNPTNCESPDLPVEGVHLQYSISGPLGPWTDINYWTPVAGNAATGPYYSWNHYTENVPTIAWTPQTQFRWFQVNTSGNTWDHWGIDNVEIKAQSGIYAKILWSTGDTTFTVVTYPQTTGPYWVTINDSMYASSDTVHITVHESPSSKFSVTSPVCSDFDSAVVAYTGNAPANADFYWTASGGLKIPPGPGPHIIDSIKAGTYTILLNVSNHGCPSDIDTAFLQVNQTPLVSFSADVLKGCDPITVNFQNHTYPLNGVQYTWEFGDGATSTDMHPQHTYYYSPNDSAYSVTLTALSDSGCEWVYTVKNLIHVFPMPVAEFYADPDSVNILTPQVSFIDQSSPYVTNWSWDFGDGSNSVDQNPIYEYKEPGEYLVHLKVVTEYGCEDTISHLVKIVEEREDSLKFPNVFTPNGDGFNDRFEFENLEAEHYLNRYFVVFNRWGKKVYEKTGYLNEWDGEGAPDGTYYFIFRYTFSFKATIEENEISGSITIIR